MSTTDLDDISSNPSSVPHFNTIVDRAVSRRGFLKRGLGAGAIGFFGTTLAACSSDSDDDPVIDDGPGGGGVVEPPVQAPKLGFEA
ncbi:MAG TPA: PhoX family phosphatase, partial [Burkholderiaceae bacterium]|nr:PhoX family phosphatase [Burkholderiaceae bacterium]